eukprot:TRINITY_DN17287_c0_g2_i2.p1 TRINITY_DN17287_c0_g2~~TRINITY_DN17287_c0_g2_i2.p1  ORF type:complete len:342 (-),score=52.68 TRINITY_DN17287_c0_g2_i2:22-1047(-)
MDRYAKSACENDLAHNTNSAKPKAISIKNSAFLSDAKYKQRLQSSLIKIRTPYKKSINPKRFCSAETKRSMHHKKLLNKEVNHFEKFNDVHNKNYIEQYKYEFRFLHHNYEEVKLFFNSFSNIINKLNDGMIYSKGYWRRMREATSHEGLEIIDSGIEITNEMARVINQLQTKANLLNIEALVAKTENLFIEVLSQYEKSLNKPTPSHPDNDYEELLRRIERYEVELLRIKPCKDLIARKGELEDKVKTLQNIIKQQHEENIENKEKLKNYSHRHSESSDIIKFTDKQLKQSEDFFSVVRAKVAQLENAIDKIQKSVSLSLIHICRCRRYAVCRSRWSPYH